PPQYSSLSLHDALPISGGQDVAFHFFGARYSLHAQRGKLTLMGLPHARSSDARQARDFIQRLSNDDLRWSIHIWPENDSLNAMADRKSTRLNSSHGSIS